MKKAIILSIAAVAVLFFSLAINTNIRNNTGSIDLKSALQSADALVTVRFAHDSPGGLSYWSGTHSGLSASSSVWWSVTQGVYVTQSYSSINQELKTINAYKPCCVYSPTGQPYDTQAIATTISYYDESGQVTNRSTTFYGEEIYIN
jgi:hypothetical protein